MISFSCIISFLQEFLVYLMLSNVIKIIGSACIIFLVRKFAETGSDICKSKATGGTFKVRENIICFYVHVLDLCLGMKLIECAKGSCQILLLYQLQFEFD